MSLLVSEENQYRHEDRRGEEAKVSRPVPVTVLTTRTSQLKDGFDAGPYAVGPALLTSSSTSSSNFLKFSAKRLASFFACSS